MEINVKLSTNSRASQVAWEFSRPLERNKSKLNQVTSLDLPVNEFSNLHLEIESTIIEREIFTTLRNHVMWAQTSRVQDVLKFTVPKIFNGYSDFYEATRNHMIFLSETQRQDDYRKVLPIVSNTKYSILISARDLVKIKKYFEYLSGILDNDDFRLLFKDSSKEMQIVLDAIGYSEDLTKNYKMKKILSEVRMPETSVAKLGGYTFISTTLPLYLRAQLVRHRNILFKDDLFQILNEPIGHLDTISKEITCKMAIDKDMLREITEKRNCWVAQYNIWKPFLDLTMQKGKPILPCDNGSCPFDADAVLRFQGKDPNSPCPIHTNQKNLKPTPLQIKQMQDMVVEDKRPVLFWNEEINKLKLESGLS